MDLRNFGSWALAQGQVGNPGSNSYVGQCVSLVQQLLDKVFGIPFKARGNAKDWANNADVLSHFNKLPVGTKLIPGDILVYGANYGEGYGHIGFIDCNGKFFDQNGVKSEYTGYRDRPFINYICVLRCKTPFKTGNEISTFTVRVDKAVANVRCQPNSQSALAGSQKLYKGDTFQTIGTVIGENVLGNDVWYKSIKGNYIWSGGLVRV